MVQTTRHGPFRVRHLARGEARAVLPFNPREPAARTSNRVRHKRSPRARISVVCKASIALRGNVGRSMDRRHRAFVATAPVMTGAFL